MVIWDFKLSRAHKLLKINDIFKLKVCSFVYKVLQSSLPLCFDGIFYNYERHNVNLRNKNNLYVPTYKKTLSRQSLLFIGAETWNSVPGTIRSEKT